MSHSEKIIKKAGKLRALGYSYEELEKSLGIPRSTIYYWVSGIKLNANARERIQFRRELGKVKAKEWHVEHRNLLWQEAKNKAGLVIENGNLDEKNGKIALACLYWAEGTKASNNLTFMNSDPKMIRTFLILLRKFFTIDESKFRVLLHLHEYHAVDESVVYYRLCNEPFRINN